MEREEKERIKKSFLKVREDISLLRESIEMTTKELTEVKEILSKKELREPLREVTTRTTTRSNIIQPTKSIQRRALITLNKAQILKAIKHYIDEGYKTNHIRDEIMTRFDIQTTCFYKYLKELREPLREPLREVTTRTTTRSSL